MNKDILSGKWREIKGRIKERCGKLTGNDLGEREGKAEKLLGLLRKNYGYMRGKTKLEYKDTVELAKTVSNISAIMKKNDFMAIAFIARYGQPLFARKQESQVTGQEKKNGYNTERYFDSRLPRRTAHPASQHSGSWKYYPSGGFGLILLILIIFLLSGCYPGPYHTVSRSAPEATSDSPQVPLTQVYFYPKAGQTAEHQSRDHYDCYNWAVQQTGFDPGQSAIPTDQRVRVVPMPPPGHDTATLAVAGAVLGALIGGPRHALGGALIGASGGAMAGAASDSARQESARQQEETYAARNRTRDDRLAEKASGFRRAMGACLEGRGYTVK
jgi:uncharacterized protein YjbJ (UPF0337 family)